MWEVKGEEEECVWEKGEEEDRLREGVGGREGGSVGGREGGSVGEKGGVCVGEGGD